MQKTTSRIKKTFSLKINNHKLFRKINSLIPMFERLATKKIYKRFIQITYKWLRIVYVHAFIT